MTWSRLDKLHDRWLNPPDHDEDGCLEICHPAHVEMGIFSDDCEACVEEKCSECEGRGYVYPNEVEKDCESCKGTGRIAWN